MARIASVNIASIYPIERADSPGIAFKASRPYHPEKGKAYVEFQLPVATPDHPVIVLPIEDCFQNVYMGQDVGVRAELISALEIATDLARAWSGSTVGTESGFGPGVGVIEGPAPDQEWLAGQRARQNGYFQLLIQRGNDAERKVRPDLISREMRLAAKIMGKEDLPWVKGAAEQLADKINCPICTTKIPRAAIFCPHCTKQIAPLPAHLDFSAGNTHAQPGRIADVVTANMDVVPQLDAPGESDAAKIIAAGKRK